MKIFKKGIAFLLFNILFFSYPLTGFSGEAFLSKFSQEFSFTSYSKGSLISEPLGAKQWALENNGNFYFENDDSQRLGEIKAVEGIDINFSKALDNYEAKRQVIVALIDTGVDINHQDLKNNIWVNTKEIAGNGIDDDQNGYIDDVYG